MATCVSPRCIAPGSSSYARSFRVPGGAADITAIMQRGPADTSSLFRGESRRQPTELISNGRFESLMKRMAQLLTGSSLIPLRSFRVRRPDARRFCDGVVLLVNSGTTPHDLARKACGSLPRTTSGVILNRVEAHHSYGSYYYYGKGTIPRERYGCIAMITGVITRDPSCPPVGILARDGVHPCFFPDPRQGQAMSRDLHPARACK